jgi:hypothetical protein
MIPTIFAENARLLHTCRAGAGCVCPSSELSSFKCSAELVSNILNWVCPECGGRMGGRGQEFKCQGLSVRQIGASFGA